MAIQTVVASDCEVATCDYRQTDGCLMQPWDGCSIAGSPDVKRQLQTWPEERTIGCNGWKWSCPSPPLLVDCIPAGKVSPSFEARLLRSFSRVKKGLDVVVVPENVGVVDQHPSFYIPFDAAQTLILIYEYQLFPLHASSISYRSVFVAPQRAVILRVLITYELLFYLSHQYYSYDCHMA